MTDASDSTRIAGQGVAWRRVGLYYGVAFGIACVLGIAMWGAGAQMFSSSAAPLFQYAVAFLYMPAPLIAALIVEKRAGNGYLLGVERRTVARNAGRIALISVAVSAGVYVAEILVTALLGNVFGVPGAGRLVFESAEVLANIAAVIPAAAQQQAALQVPPAGALYALGLAAGVGAGFTINGVFAFGEEYGWRGVLMDELRPLGAVRANLLTGVMWGLWHAPLIALGFNYGAQWAWGVAMMCVWVTPFSFVLWRAREFSRSVVAPAIIHGAFNGTAGFYLLLIAGRSPLIAVPAGLAGALAMTLVALVVWNVVRPTPALEDVRSEAAAPEPVGDATVGSSSSSAI